MDIRTDITKAMGLSGGYTVHTSPGEAHGVAYQ